MIKHLKLSVKKTFGAFFTLSLMLLIIYGLIGYQNVHAAASSLLIPGIDYTRLTQKAYNKNGAYYEVTLSLGELISIKGRLVGTEGLDIDEMNEIIEWEMESHGLNAADVAVLSSVGANLTKAQYIELAKKLASAASNYIPGETAGVSTIVNTLLYGMPDHNVPLDDLRDTYTKKYLEKTITKIIEESAKNAGKGAVPKVKGVGLVGFVLDSIYVGKDLMDNSQYDAFCAKLTEQYAQIGNFYSSCSRKLNDAVTEKNLNRRTIVFDDYSNATTNAVFLGVDGVKMRYKLRGKLKNKVSLDEFIDPGDNSGTYEGDLTLEIEAYDMENDFDFVFDDECTLWTKPSENDWCYILYKYPGVPLKRSDLRTFYFYINNPSILKRKLKGHFTLTISQHEITGPITPKLSGSFNSISDEIDFLMDMACEQEEKAEIWNPSIGKNLGYPKSKWNIKGYVHGGTYIDSVHVSFSANEAYNFLYNNQSVGNVLYSGSGQDMRISPSDLGTVWYPLEYAPKIQITVPN